MQAGSLISESDLIALRPCPKNGIDPFNTDQIIGKTLKYDVGIDQLVNENDFRSS
jgi:sialic acid synthase SpsE